MTVRAHLIAARALIECGWCQGSFATDECGHACGPHDSWACAWCAIGAIRSAIPSDMWFDDRGWLASAAAVSRVAAAARLKRNSLDRWNDAPGRTQAQVLAAFDRAIAAAGDQ